MPDPPPPGHVRSTWYYRCSLAGAGAWPSPALQAHLTALPTALQTQEKLRSTDYKPIYSRRKTSGHAWVLNTAT
ncbi:hypothetical protein AG1IA_08532 [Rhizoctonia solani AG-1 IA]|uniref:Uncharacterized protein n=1 Tax=Thanatephorus cucumeris (strain AG1-IA) TaxID=983506 RepID=L8WL14_THACA|nr:hypothetical protein AG1IA_08532 [Rhizoctonia solani AG-1 IA]